MENIKAEAIFVAFQDKSGVAKASGKPYRICTLRVLIGRDVYDFQVNPDKVKIEPLMALKGQEDLVLELTLGPSGEAGFASLEPRVRLVGVKVAK